MHSDSSCKTEPEDAAKEDEADEACTNLRLALVVFELLCAIWAVVRDLDLRDVMVVVMLLASVDFVISMGDAHWLATTLEAEATE